jgi:hypothetical protein
VLVTIFRALGHHLVDNGQQGRRHIIPERIDRFGLPRLMPDEFLGHRTFFEGCAPRQQVVECSAQAIDVRAGVCLMTVDRLLRGQVIGRPQYILIVFLGEDVFFIIEKAS